MIELIRRAQPTTVIVRDGGRSEVIDLQPTSDIVEVFGVEGPPEGELDWSVLGNPLFATT